MNVSVAGSVAGGDLAVTVMASVTNTGQRAGAEVVQVYVGDTEASVAAAAGVEGVRQGATGAWSDAAVSCHRRPRVRVLVNAVPAMGRRVRRVRDRGGQRRATWSRPKRSLLRHLGCSSPLGPDSTLHERLDDERAASSVNGSAAIARSGIDQGDWDDADAHPGGIPRHGVQPRRAGGAGRRALDPVASPRLVSVCGCYSSHRR